jgi:hypothetical protein
VEGDEGGKRPDEIDAGGEGQDGVGVGGEVQAAAEEAVVDFEEDGKSETAEDGEGGRRSCAAWEKIGGSGPKWRPELEKAERPRNAAWKPERSGEVRQKRPSRQEAAVVTADQRKRRASEKGRRTMRTTAAEEMTIVRKQERSVMTKSAIWPVWRNWSGPTESWKPVRVAALTAEKIARSPESSLPRSIVAADRKTK